MAGGFRTAGLALLYSMFTENSPHYRDFDKNTDKRGRRHFRRALATMEAVRKAHAEDWFVNMRALVAADIFSDIMEMAEYLLEEKYKDAAAVLIGSSLEAHLRRLATANGIAVEYLDNKSGKMKPKMASMLNDELHKAGVYEKNDHRFITAWITLRNEAAHGHYKDYDQQKVEDLLSGVRGFFLRVPA